MRGEDGGGVGGDTVSGEGGGGVTGGGVASEGDDGGRKIKSHSCLQKAILTPHMCGQVLRRLVFVASTCGTGQHIRMCVSGWLLVCAQVHLHRGEGC